jgi:hypothetical protein
MVGDGLNQSQSPWVSYRIAFVPTNHKAPITRVFEIQVMAAAGKANSLFCIYCGAFFRYLVSMNFYLMLL